MTDEEVLQSFLDNGFGEVKRYRNKTSTELEKEYQEYLYSCYFRDKKEGKAYCDTYENWYKSYWRNHNLSYTDWLKTANKKTLE